MALGSEMDNRSAMKPEPGIRASLWLELFRLEGDGTQVVVTRLQSQLDVPFLPAFGLAIHRNLIEFVLRFVPQLER